MLQNGQSVPGGYDIAYTWLTSPDRADYVNHVDAVKNGFVPECGCAVLFIYYLFAPARLHDPAAHRGGCEGAGHGLHEPDR